MNASTYRVRARNTATQSENRIHDDAVARDLGFRGGLVPGVDVYAYLTHPLVERWGRPWLERGAAHARFLKPVYDGEEVVVTCVAHDGDRVTLEVRNPAGDLCATAEASLPATPPAAPDPATHPPAPLPDDPPRASVATLGPGAMLGSLEGGFHADRAGEYLSDVRESLDIYRTAAIAHPGWLLRKANFVLAANVRLGPWIHVASSVQHHGVATDGTHISTRARVAEAYERKGHRFVDLDVLLVADGARPIVHVLHTAIYEPRGSMP